MLLRTQSTWNPQMMLKGMKNKVEELLNKNFGNLLLN